MSQSWWNSSWSRRKRVMVKNRGSATLTNHVVRLELKGSNFQFSVAKAAGADVRVVENDQSTAMTFWLQDYDETASPPTATLYVKVASLPVDPDTVFWVYYGNSAATTLSDPASTLLFWDDLGSLTGWTATGSTWATTSDAVRGTVMEATTAAADIFLHQANTDEDYFCELWERREVESGSSDADPGVMANMADTTNYAQGGVRRAANIHAFDKVADVVNQNVQRTISPAPDLDVWLKARCIEKASTDWTTGDTLSNVLNGEGLTTDGTKLYMAEDPTIHRYTKAGVLEESAPDVTDGATPSMGGLTFYNGRIYGVHQDNDAGNEQCRVLSWDPDDLASGHTVEATLTSLLDSVAVNFEAIARKDGYWILGTATGAAGGGSQSFYIFNDSWEIVKKCPVSYYHSFGAQDMEFVGNILYVMHHDQYLLKYSWDVYNLEFDLVDAWDMDADISSTFGHGITHDGTDFFISDDPNTPGSADGIVIKGTMADSGTDRRMVVYPKGNIAGLGQSPGIVSIDYTDKTQASIGLKSFRDCRFDDLALYPRSDNRPIAKIDKHSEKLVP